VNDRQPDLIVPVPLHIRRFRERGFNQSWMLVQEWPELFRRRHSGTLPELVRDALVRHRWTEPQAGLDRRRRKTNIKGAFSVSGHVDILGKRVLLVDDVYTTGATAEECASVLLKNGASDVHILTLARTSH
jgi:ComF family protein